MDKVMVEMSSNNGNEMIEKAIWPKGDTLFEG
jgi:hypothetical protein